MVKIRSKASGSSSRSPAADTRLRRDLLRSPVLRATPRDALVLARRRWLQGERIDIGALAAELSVSRATLFRWVGSRELLLAEILWSFFEPTLAAAEAGLRVRGARRVGRCCERAVRAILDFQPLRRFIASDPEYALRLLTSKASPVQARTVAAVHALLEREADSGEWQPPLAVATLAYLVVRLGESFIYADAISDHAVDATDAGLAIELLLSGSVAGARKSKSST
jgi:AcrR family transcriptional regulator